MGRRPLFLFSGLASVVVAASLLGAGCDEKQDELPTTLGLPQGINYDALYVLNGAGDSITIIDTEKEYINPSRIHLRNASFPHYLTLSKDRQQLLLTADGVGTAPPPDGGAPDARPDAKVDAGFDAGFDAGEEPIDAGEDAGEQEAGTPFTLARASSRVLADTPSPKKGALLLLKATTGVTIKGRFTDAPLFNAIFSPDEDDIWATSMTSPGNALLITPTTLADRLKVEVENQPGRITISKNGRYAFVVNSGSNSVTVIDAASKVVRATLKNGSGAGVWQGENDLAYIDDAEKGTLTSVQTTNLGIRRTFELGFQVGTVVPGPDGFLWITDPKGGRVVLYQTDTDVKVWEIATGRGAYGIAFSDDGKWGYVSNTEDNTVSIIDVKGRRVHRRLLGISSPNWIVFRKKDNAPQLPTDGGKK
ncbi:YncE family protein [Pendulispora brunnea]|uniref:YncE family protein n=1 Tax=Pendulispora brunnea TaxID=2905690 RepID=A0ABZ2KKB3_9BACT